MNLFLQLLANGVANGAKFAVLACGFGLVYGSIGVFHVAYGGVFVLSAYVFHSLVTVAGLDWWKGGAVAVGLSAAVGWVMEKGFYHPFFRRGTAPGAVMVASLGLGIVIENGLALVYGNEIRAIPRDLAGAVTLRPARLTTIQVGQFVVCGVVLVGLAVAGRLRFFRVVRAMGENPELLEAHNALRDEEGFATIIVEHRLRQVQSYVDRALVMREGGSWTTQRIQNGYWTQAGWPGIS